jgi:fluoroquinolone resistance protein
MAKISRKDLIERWRTVEGKKRRDEIIKALTNNSLFGLSFRDDPLANLPFIEKIEGLYDLRGLELDEKTCFKKVNMRNIDFSYSNFNYPHLDRVLFENVVFDNCDCTEMLLYNCQFTNCRFTKSKFNNAGFGIDSGQYIDCIFEDSNLRGASFFYPTFSNCMFKNCKLDGVDFCASHFNNVKFIGHLEDVWFRGESPNPEDQIMHRKKGHGLNPMNVDFSEASLWYVTISDNCDLTKVIMPNDGNHYLIKNIKRVLRYLEEEINGIDSINEQRFVKLFIELYKYHIAKQDMVIINLNNLISIAQEYLREDAKVYCNNFLKLLLKISEEE